MKYSSVGDGSEIIGTVLVLAERSAQSVFRNAASKLPNCIEKPGLGASLPSAGFFCALGFQDALNQIFDSFATGC